MFHHGIASIQIAKADHAEAQKTAEERLARIRDQVARTKRPDVEDVAFLLAQYDALVKAAGK